ncbi:MAG TPA: recombination regulator RecX [Rhodocyclaceae bacterium]|nr:recombination regulator RecX [Rhodocyclaceae bacterium]
MPDSLRVQALKVLARREYSRAELRAKLAPHAESEEQLDSLLDALQAERLLSDQRYANQRVIARAGRFGNSRLKQELRTHGVGDEDIAAAMEESGGDETERCRAVWNKKFGHPPASAEERAKQMRFLQYRGFSADAIRRVLKGEEE